MHEVWINRFLAENYNRKFKVINKKIRDINTYYIIEEKDYIWIKFTSKSFVHHRYIHASELIIENGKVIKCYKHTPEQYMMLTETERLLYGN